MLREPALVLRCTYVACFVFYSVGQQPKSGVGCLNLEVYISHTIRSTHNWRHSSERAISSRRGRYPQSTQQTQEKNIHDFFEVRTRDTSSRAASDLRLRRHGHQDHLRDLSRDKLFLPVKAVQGKLKSRKLLHHIFIMLMKTQHFCVIMYKISLDFNFLATAYWNQHETQRYFQRNYYVVLFVRRCTKFMKGMLSLEETSVGQALLFVSKISVQLLTYMVLEEYTERCPEKLIFQL